MKKALKTGCGLLIAGVMAASVAAFSACGDDKKEEVNVSVSGKTYAFSSIEVVYGTGVELTDEQNTQYLDYQNQWYANTTVSFDDSNFYLTIASGASESGTYTQDGTTLTGEFYIYTITAEVSGDDLTAQFTKQETLNGYTFTVTQILTYTYSSEFTTSGSEEEDEEEGEETGVTVTSFSVAGRTFVLNPNLGARYNYDYDGEELTPEQLATNFDGHTVQIIFGEDRNCVLDLGEAGSNTYQYEQEGNQIIIYNDGVALSVAAYLEGTVLWNPIAISGSDHACFLGFVLEN